MNDGVNIRLRFKIEEMALQGCTCTEIYHNIDEYFPHISKVRAIRENVLNVNTLNPDEVKVLIKFFQKLKADDESDIVYKIHQSQPRKAKLKDNESTLTTTEIEDNNKEKETALPTIDEDRDLLCQFKCGKYDARKDFTNPSNWDFPIQRFVLLHQSQPQQYLLNRYGSIIHITEIKTENYGSNVVAVSLFLICVRTNVDYQVVGTILCNKYNDHKKVLKEALTEFKEINEFWKPKYLMIDPSEKMVSVVEELFPGNYLFTLIK